MKSIAPILPLLLLTACTGGKNPTTTPADAAQPQTDTEQTQTINEDTDDLGLQAIENVDWEAIAVEREFLADVMSSEYRSDEWFETHCSPSVQKYLLDANCYDNEGYARWELNGSLSGSEIVNSSAEIAGMSYGSLNGKPVHAITKVYPLADNTTFSCTFYFGLKPLGDGDYMITYFSHTDFDEGWD